MGRKQGRKKFQRGRPKGKNITPTRDISSFYPPWIDLPIDLTANILHRLGVVEILENAQKVCTTWRSVCQEPSFWRIIEMKKPRDGSEIFYDFDMMCRHAVDRSQGKLIDISIEYFATDELLHYISSRSSHLKRLRLACCKLISGKGLTEAVKNFPQLEELHLFFMPSIHPKYIETVSISCPMLKSFTFNKSWLRCPSVGVANGYAVAVARNMPNLRHLRLFGNRLNNEALQAILDGCPNLELLDLRQCFDVDLGGELGERCSQQIKDLRHSVPSVPCGYPYNDYEQDDGLYYDSHDEYRLYYRKRSPYPKCYPYDDYERDNELYYHETLFYRRRYSFVGSNHDVDSMDDYDDDYIDPFDDLDLPVNLEWYLDHD